MKKKYLNFMCCPACRESLEIKVFQELDERVSDGELVCVSCSNVYPIKGYIPRFVEHSSYAESFGTQWNAFARSQIDTADNKESEIRFDTELGWSEASIESKVVIEIGCGAGRFLDIVSKRGADVAVGLDLTTAVEAAYENLSDRDNVLIVQGDAFNSPFKDGVFECAYSIGVLHHTPDPEAAFSRMTQLVGNDGLIGVSLYEISLYHRPNRNSLKVLSVELLWALNLWRVEFFRLFTTKIPDKAMVSYCRWFIPILHFINKLPMFRYVRYLFPSICYRHLPLIWSQVDTMDTYSTKIVHQYRGKDVFQWFRRKGLGEVVLQNGRAGWVSITGVKNYSGDKNIKINSQPLGPGLVGAID